MLMRQILNRSRTRESTCPELARQPLRGVAIGLAGKAAAGVRSVELFDCGFGGRTGFGPVQCGKQHSSGEAAEEMLRTGRGGGERGWLERAAAQDRDDVGSSFSPYTPSKKIIRGLHEKQALWRSGCLRAGPKQICLRRLFHPSFEHQDDKSPLRERPEDLASGAAPRRRADDDDGGATLRRDGRTLVRIYGAGHEPCPELGDVKARFFTI